MTRGPFGLPWVVWAGLAFVVALVFSLVAPGSAGTTGLQYLILRWFHPLTWALLGSSAVLRGLPEGGAPRVADLLAHLALAIYLVFLVTFVLR